MNVEQISNKNTSVINNPEQVLAADTQAVIKKGFIELGISLIFASLTAAFLASPFAMPLLFALPVFMVIFNATVRMAPIFIQSRINILRAAGQNEEEIARLERHLSRSLKVVKVICPFNFAMVDINTRGLIMHEAGHCLAASILYNNADTSIKLYPGAAANPLWIFTGDASWSSRELSFIGQNFGHNGSNMIVAGAGAGITLVGSIILFILSYRYRKKHPELSRYLLASAVASTIQHMFYALSVFWEKATSHHDFATLAAGGMHPLLAPFFLVLPLLVRGVIEIKDSFQCKRLENRQIEPQTTPG